MSFTRKQPFLTRGLFAVVAAAVTLAAPAEAAKIDFDQAAIPVTGSLSFDGGGIGVGTVSGSDLAFDTIKGFDTPFNAGAGLICATCALSFTTGTLTNVASVGPVTVYTFGAGGTVTLTGDVAADPFGIPPHPGSPPGTVLVTGSFSSSTLTIIGGTFNFSGLGTDTKEDDLVEYFMGIGANTPPIEWRASTTELGGTGLINPLTGAFDSTSMTLVDFANTVPEPGTTALFLLGLSGIVAHGRRRRK